jgi:hypothetical protein
MRDKPKESGKVGTTAEKFSSIIDAVQAFEKTIAKKEAVQRMEAIKEIRESERRACYGKAADALLELLHRRTQMRFVYADDVAKLLEEFKVLAHK